MVSRPIVIAIDPCYISKAGKKTPHIGRFWSGCAGAVKHGLEIMGIGLLDVANNKCMMLRAHQTIGNSALKMRNKTLVGFCVQRIVRLHECRQGLHERQWYGQFYGKS